MPIQSEWLPEMLRDQQHDRTFLLSVTTRSFSWMPITRTPAALSAGEGHIPFGLAFGTPEWPIFEHAVRVFGNVSQATGWLTAKCPVLNARPIELLESGENRERVADVLNCIEHGMIY